MAERDEKCPRCAHSFDEHDGMGDCHHEDRRRLTGYCACGERASTGEDR